MGSHTFPVVQIVMNEAKADELDKQLVVDIGEEREKSHQNQMIGDAFPALTHVQFCY